VAGQTLAELRTRVLGASLDRRSPGRTTPAPPEISTLEALSRGAASFGDVLAGLTDDQWRLPVLRGLDVQGLVGHLVGVERDVVRALRADPEVADADHVDSTQDAAVAHHGEPPAETLRAWQDAVAASLAEFAAVDPGQPAALHTLRLQAASLMMVRTFELWAHENDIRLVTGLEPSVPDDSTLVLMTDLAARGLSLGALRTGLRDAIDLRLVLTGRGGGTWEVRLGPTTGAAERVGIVADAVSFCRLAANRLDPDDLEIDPRGDRARVADVLAAAAALALD
jgi:uncharacterized protein (TIGR03083 family)